jgi:hypothetical protein
LALTANQFTVPFNYIPFAVTGNADHFNLLEESAYRAIERVPFRMPFNSKYQPSYRVASDRSPWQGWNTDHFPEVFVAIIHDTENCCPRGANLKFHWTTNLLCVWPLLVCHWLKVLDRLLRYSSD